MAESFRTSAEFRAWLEKHHASETELILRLFKTHAKHRGMGYREGLDEALCFGWIDSVRRSLDDDSFTQPAPYSFESKPAELDAASEKKLRANKRAWTFLQAQPPGYRRIVTFWVMSAKREETRARRLGILIEYSAKQTRIPPLTQPK